MLWRTDHPHPMTSVSSTSRNQGAFLTSISCKNSKHRYGTYSEDKVYPRSGIRYDQEKITGTLRSGNRIQCVKKHRNPNPEPWDRDKSIAIGIFEDYRYVRYKNLVICSSPWQRLTERQASVGKPLASSNVANTDGTATSNWENRSLACFNTAGSKSAYCFSLACRSACFSFSTASLNIILLQTAGQKENPTTKAIN
jgi:hypothetical protein